MFCITVLTSFICKCFTAGILVRDKVKSVGLDVRNGILVLLEKIAVG